VHTHTYLHYTLSYAQGATRRQSRWHRPTTPARKACQEGGGQPRYVNYASMSESEWMNPCIEHLNVICNTCTLLTIMQSEKSVRGNGSSHRARDKVSSDQDLGSLDMRGRCACACHVRVRHKNVVRVMCVWDIKIKHTLLFTVVFPSCCMWACVRAWTCVFQIEVGEGTPGEDSLECRILSQKPFGILACMCVRDMHAVYSSVLQCVTMCCNMLCCGAVCCGVLQCVAECSNVKFERDQHSHEHSMSNTAISNLWGCQLV